MKTCPSISHVHFLPDFFLACLQDHRTIWIDQWPRVLNSQHCAARFEPRKGWDQQCSEQRIQHQHWAGNAQLMGCAMLAWRWYCYAEIWSSMTWILWDIRILGNLHMLPIGGEIGDVAVHRNLTTSPVRGTWAATGWKHCRCWQSHCAASVSIQMFEVLLADEGADWQGGEATSWPRKPRETHHCRDSISF